MSKSSNASILKKFEYGNYSYEYELMRQARKTLSLTVNPDMSIVLKCPIEASEDRIESFLSRKWAWLEKQLNFFKKTNRARYAKEYISGESFYYLGRQYKLEVKASDKEKVTLAKGRLLVFSSRSVLNGEHNNKLLSVWYAKKRAKVFKERFEEMKKRFDFKITPELMTRKMQKRWGSFLNNEKILLNPELIHTSKNCIDYVIVHELCHMKYKNHDKKFYGLLEEKYPKWQKVKEKLENYQIN